jgi:uncharacterized protein (TIGR03435 family)
MTITVSSCLALICATAALAQPAVEFEAASVKLQKSVTIDPSRPSTLPGSIPMMQGGPGTATPGRIRYSNVTLNGLILKAYDFESDQVLGRSDWMNEERYAIDTLVPAGATREQFRQMLRNLLTSRFKLAVRWEERDFKVYRLVLANGGPKLKPSLVIGPDDDDYDLPTKQRMSMNAALDMDGCPVLAPDRRGSIGRNGCTTYIGYSMPELAFWLAMMVGNETGSNVGPDKSWAHIVEATGLTGRFDFTLKYDNLSHYAKHVRDPAESHP